MLYTSIAKKKCNQNNDEQSGGRRMETSICATLVTKAEWREVTMVPHFLFSLIDETVITDYGITRLTLTSF